MAKSATKEGRRRLGRGLGSLIAAPVEVESTPAAHAAAGESSLESTPSSGDLASLAPVDIQPNPHQPRRVMDDAALQALADSMRKSGLMQPVVVRPNPAGGFELIAGERRWRAAQLAGLSSIPAVVRDIDDRTSAEWALIENLQREDLNPLERAEAFRGLADQFGLTHQEIAEAVGLDRSTVSNHLRILELDEPTRQAVAQGILSMGHAKALLGITNLSERQQLAARAIKSDWSVRELERRTREGGGGQPTTSTPKRRTLPVHMQDLETKLGEHLGTRVQLHLNGKKKAGRVSIEFYDLAQFDGLMQRLGFRLDP